MNVPTPAIPHAAGLFRTAAVRAGCLAIAIVAPGCIGPAAVSHTRTRYNEVYRATNDEEILLNIVRLRYADSPIFVDLPNITSQFEVAALGNYTGGTGNQFPGHTNLGFGQLGLRDTPTLSYHPRSGQEIAKALLTPLSTELITVVNAGANIEQFMLMTVNDINDVPNAARATAMIPSAPSDNCEFRRGIRLLTELEQRGVVELTVRKLEDTEGSDAIPINRIRGGDLVSAAKENYVFRKHGNDQMTMRKEERTFVVRVRLEDVDSPEMQELARIFHLKPGLPLYKVKSELSGEHPERQIVPESLEVQDTIYVNMRSILQTGIFLSKGVCVPEEHVLKGIAPMTLGPDGQLYDWTQITDGLFCVHAQRHRPRDAEVAVRYRGYWFYIAPDDVNSRAVMAVFEILFAVQESEGKPLGPLLTLPLGG